MFARNGFVPRLRREVWAKLKHLQTDTCPFANLPEKKRTQWALTRVMYFEIVKCSAVFFLLQGLRHRTMAHRNLVFILRNERTETQLSAEAFPFLVCGIIEPPVRTVNKASSFSKSTGFRRCASKPASRARSSSQA